MNFAEVYCVTRSVMDAHVERNGPLKRPVPLWPPDGLIGTISTTQKIKIDLAPIPYNRNHLGSFIIIYEYPTGREATLVYSAQLNVCWSRFAIAKEAMGALLSKKSNYTTDPVSHVAGLIMQVPEAINDDGLEADYAASYAALECLFPKEFTADLYEMHGAGKTAKDIAFEFRAPEATVSLRLSPQLRNLFDKCQCD